MALSPAFLDELRARTTLSSVIMRTDKLQRAGREWKACCPFHDEKTPSFTVNDAKGFYHCFGCGAHGDVIRWMTDQRGMQFMDAVKELSAEAGLEMPAPDPQAAKRAEQRATLIDVTEAAQTWYVDQLAGGRGAAARHYLASRGFSEAVCREFGFGYAPEARQALKTGLGTFDEAMLVDAGMRIEADGRDNYDRFRERLMLPIQDQRGRVIAFGGRILGTQDGVAKYLNSPDTPLFDKGRTLYNLHRAAPASRKTDRMVVVEGYMDVVALANAGIEDAVAPLGTALTEAQIELLWKHVDAPILCFDGDAAGQRAAMRAVERALPLLRPGHTLQIVQLPAGLDPDDLLRRDGRGALDRLLDTPRTVLDILWHHERDAQPLATPESKAGLKARLLAHVDTIADRDIAALYRRDLLERFSTYAFPPREQRKGQGRWQQSRPATGRLTATSRHQLDRASGQQARSGLACAIVTGLARWPNLIAVHGETLLNHSDADLGLLGAIDYLIDAAESLEPGATNPISLPESIAPPPDETRFSFLCEGTDPRQAQDDLAEAVALLVERPALAAALDAATARFADDPEAAFAEQQRLLKRKLDFERRLGQMVGNRAARAAQQIDVI